MAFQYEQGDLLMEITQHPGLGSLELRLKGRFDAAWADHVDNTIENAVRAGSHQIVLNFAGVHYISSLGIRVLVNHYKKLKAVNGRLSVIEPSSSTLAVLKAVGLADLLLGTVTESAAASLPKTPTKMVRGAAAYEVYAQAAAKPLSCVAVGNPEKLTTTGFSDGDCQPLRFAGDTFGIGLGAFGAGFADCQNRFGEFLAAGGCAITQPTNDPHAPPDYVVEQGTLVPQVETFYAIVGAGDFSSMVRFDATPEGSGTVGLTELTSILLEFSKAPAAAFVVLAEVAGVVGAILRKSPAATPASLSLPGVRDWLSFTTERSSDRNLALLVGFAASEVPEQAAGFLRRMEPNSGVQAHIHAVLFPYRPVQRGELQLGKTISEVLSQLPPKAVMHLMSDTRPFEGMGETALVRGACWVGPLQTISRG